MTRNINARRGGSGDVPAEANQPPDRGVSDSRSLALGIKPLAMSAPLSLRRGILSFENAVERAPTDD